MPVADMLVDAVAGHELLSFMDGKIQPFSPLLRLQGQNEFVWEPKHQEAFDSIKAYLASPPVLIPPRAGIPLKLYISAAEASIGSLLAQDDEGGIEHAIFYLSRTLTDCETRYTPMEKLCLTLYFSACKLRHYLLSFTTCIIAQTDLVIYMLSRPILRGCIGKWVLALSEFSLQYVPQKAVKGQAIADFHAHHPTLEIPALKELEIASTTTARPDLARIPEYAAEYEALIIGLEVLLEMGVKDVQICGDSQLVINQLQEKYRCASWLLVPYLNRTIELLDQFDNVDLEHIPRQRNFAANELAQLATGITLKYGVRERILKVERRILPSWLARPDPPDDPVVAVLEHIDVDWRIPLIEYLKQPDPRADRKIHFLALNYFLRGDELRRRGEDGIDFWFGIPEVLVSDLGAAFMGGPVAELVNDFGIQFIHSTPYYAQSNGQAEASNRTIITLLKKMLVENPRQWHDTLYETLWAYRTSKRNPIATTPYALMFGHDAVLPLEINVHSLRVQEQHHLIGEDYVQAMWQEREDLSGQRLAALDNLVMDKRRIARAYDKRTRGRSYKEGYLVWKAVLPLGEKLTGRGKWTTRWEGPFVIHRILERGAFHLKDVDGDIHHNPINSRFLKKYYPSVWEFEDPPDQSLAQAGGQT
ncbi:uncharacterized protein LOC112199695 [Rosa chinensis]|uniref:uncharacterized protein LOC112199695 n=1 Tax=Rosa chinensis TaxID=74649 RepID=UPI000D08B1EE|nr:uncharacterized protein LOC112199695 [Rosa chinensis]